MRPRFRAVCRFLGLVLLLAMIALPARPEPVEGRGLAALPQRHELANGLTLLTEERPTSRAVSVNLTVRAGSRDDGDSPGLLYFLSRAHMLGTERRPSESAVQQAITSTGGTLERGTGRDFTQFLVNVPADELDTALELLADILQHSLFDEGALEREKGVVALEINRRLGNPSEVASDLLYGTLFEGHPLGRPIVGTVESTGALDRSRLLEARDRYYGAENLVLAVAGRVRHGHVAAKVERYLGAVASGEPNVLAPMPAAIGGIKRAEQQAGRQQAIIQIAVPAPAADHPDRYPFAVLNDVLGLVSGRIFTEIRGRRGLAYVAGSGVAGFQDTGVWLAYAGADPQNVEEVIVLLLEEMRRARDEPLAVEELEGAIGHAAGRELVSGESNSARAQRLARRALLGLMETDDAIIEGLKRVTLEDVQRVARTYFDLERYVVAIVKP